MQLNDTEVRKKLKNHIIKKIKILGVARNGSISADWILGLPTLSSIISDISQSIFKIFVPIWLQISWIFRNTPNILYWNGFEESYGQKKHKTQKSENMPFWANSEI